MRFCLCDIVTYNKLYAKENHVYIQLQCLEDLEGFQGINVIVHEFDALSDGQDLLQKQVEALATFGLVRLVYVDEEGNENKFYNVLKSVTDSKGQREISYTDTAYTEEQVKALMDSEEDGCASGACAI